MNHIDNFRILNISEGAIDKYRTVKKESNSKMSVKKLIDILYRDLGIMIVLLQNIDSVLHNLLILEKQMASVTDEIDMNEVLKIFRRDKKELIEEYIDKPNVPDDSMNNYINLIVKRNIISKEQGEVLHSYRISRNNYVHKAFVLNPEKLLKAVHIIESIYDVAAITIVLSDFTESLSYDYMAKVFGSGEVVDFFKEIGKDAIDKLSE